MRLPASSITIETTPESRPSPPSWFGEVVLIVEYLRKHDVLTKISEQVRFARRRFRHYEVIDFLAILIALRDQWRTHSGGLLRAPPALCRFLYGVV